MGPNASGKTTLAMTIMGNPKYKVVGGRIVFEGRDITNLEPHERAKLGIHMVFQNPPSIKGLRVDYLLSALASKFGGEGLDEALEAVGLPRSIKSREVNVGFSGGERKRFELAQLLLVKPKLAILDEPDSGVDVDSLKVIGKAVQSLADDGAGVLLITHYRYILEHVKVDRVSVMYDGVIAACGRPDLAEKIEACGYECVVKEGRVCPGQSQSGWRRGGK
jgi:Fe-S cluster assembly ATP-binding protein